MPQFYCPNLKPGIVELDADESHHLRASQRVQAGERVRLFDGRGTTAQGRVLCDEGGGRLRGKAQPATVHIEIESLERVAPPARTLTLIVAAPKGDRLEWMIEKCTELGVSRIVLAQFERSVVQPGETRLDKLNRIAREACKQCGRAWLPEIAVSPDAASAAISVKGAVKLIADLTPGAPCAAATLAGTLATHVAIVIGPEGGLSDNDRATLKTIDARPVRLSEHTLRIETAAIAVAALNAGIGAPAVADGM